VVKSGGTSLRLTVKVSGDVRPGVALAEGKWWESDKPAAALNRLTPSQWSPAGQPAYNDVFITVEAAQP
jgi:anaerobic selenocysteine-containing dehydrogenase